MTEDKNPSPAVNHHRRNQGLLILTLIFLVIGIVWFFYWFTVSRFEENTNDAYVNGNMVQLMSQIPGTVTQINADDTQWVKEGQTIISFDPTDTNIGLQQAQAKLAETVRQVRQLYEDVMRARATLSLQKANLDKADADVKRRNGLVGLNAVSREELQHYQINAETAKAQFAVVLHNLNSAEALVANSDLYHHPLVEQAEANLRTAYVNAQRTVVRAPVTGYIAKRSVQVGQYVMVNTPMLAIVPLKEIWVDANYKESQLSYLRIGQNVTLTADAYPSVTYHGKIFGLNAGTGAAFSLLPPQNATGNWIKIVQRLPVRIEMNPDELKNHPLQLGLSMDVTTDIRNQQGSTLSRITDTKPLYTTTIYSEQLNQANQLIDKIVRENSDNMTMTPSVTKDTH